MIDIQCIFSKYRMIINKNIIFCLVIDCVLSEWSSWSGCDSACGRGVARRSRHVIHPAANGGQECEALEQTRSCTGADGDCARKHRSTLSAFSGMFSISNYFFFNYYRNRMKVQKLLANFTHFEVVGTLAFYPSYWSC
jgi:Spondin-like TSP1 domain